MAADWPEEEIWIQVTLLLLFFFTWKVHQSHKNESWGSLHYKDQLGSYFEEWPAEDHNF